MTWWGTEFRGKPGAMIRDADFSVDAEARRGRTLDRLDAEDVFCHPGLMRLPGVEAVRFPEAEAIALRALALVVVGCEGTSVGGTLVGRLIEEYRPPFSAAERRWLDSAKRDPAQSRAFGWRFEAALVLLWAVGLAPALKRPDAQTEPFEIMAPLVHFRREELLARAERRSAAEILDLADLHFCWECAAQLELDSGEPPPAGLDADVLLERHHAFIWLVGGGGDWDSAAARA